MASLYRRHQPLFVKWLVLASLLSFFLIAQKELFRVQIIECQKAGSEACEDYILSDLNSLKGKDLLFNRLDLELAQVSFSQPTQVKLISRHLPNKIVVEAQTESGLYFLDQTSLAVSRDGKVFVQSKNSSLARVKISGVEIGEELNLQQMARAIAPYHPMLSKLILELNQLQSPIKELDWVSDDWILINLQSGWQILTEASVLPHTARQVKIILDSSQAKQAIPEQTQIDLRFRLPVLRNRS